MAAEVKLDSLELEIFKIFVEVSTTNPWLIFIQCCTNVHQRYLEDTLLIQSPNHQVTPRCCHVAPQKSLPISPHRCKCQNIFVKFSFPPTRGYFGLRFLLSLFPQKAEYSCKHPHLVLKHCANTTNCLLFFLGAWWEYLMWGGCRAFRKQPD